MFWYDRGSMTKWQVYLLFLIKKLFFVCLLFFLLTFFLTYFFSYLLFFLTYFFFLLTFFLDKKSNKKIKKCEVAYPIIILKVFANLLRRFQHRTSGFFVYLWKHLRLGLWSFDGLCGMVIFW